ncbi:MAG: hypothetical protein ABIN39_08370 [candidate division WOR-3 bacterium]
MPGFWGVFSKSKSFKTVELEELISTNVIKKRKNFEKGFIFQNSLNKFLNDKVFFEDDEIFICFEGLFFNHNDLRKEYSVNDNFYLIKKLFFESKNSFPSKIFGNYTGFIYDKKEDSIYLFTCQNGTKTLFYFYDEKEKFLVFGNSLRYIIEILKNNGYDVELDADGAYCLITVGYMLGGRTLVKNVKKIKPATILKFNGNDIVETNFFKISSYPIGKKEEKIIAEELDNLFIEAVKAEYNKDIEYRYKHVATLSGGLDSRTNLLNAHRLGYKDVLCLCFSENDYLDEKISKKIASDFQDLYLFYSLNNGKYLMDIDNPVMANDGLIFYAGSSYMYEMFSLLDFNNYGLMHTGVAGNEVLYTSLKYNYHERPSLEKIERIFYSSKLINKVKHILDELTKMYETMEELAFYEKCVNGMYNAFRNIEHFTEFSSPSLYPPTLEYIMKIDPKLKYNAYVYRKWVLKKVPKINYPWEHIAGAKVSGSDVEIFFRKAKKKMATIFLGYRPSKNPWEKWRRDNPILMETLDKYFFDNIDLLKGDLKNDCVKLYTEGNLKEKTQPLTLLSFIKINEVKVNT